MLKALRERNSISKPVGLHLDAFNEDQPPKVVSFED